MSEEMNYEEEITTMEQALNAGLLDVQPDHAVVDATIVDVTDDNVTVDIGSKQEIVMLKREWSNPAPDSLKDVANVGDVIRVYVNSTDGDNGGNVSKRRADAEVAWDKLIEMQERGDIVEAKVGQVVKGGLVAYVEGLRGFIPASQIELHFVKDLNSYIGKIVEVEIIEINVQKQRLVLSRRNLLLKERKEREEEVYSQLQTGQIVRGVVRRLVDYGAFIDIGGVDGLAHISDLAWERVKNPADILTIGQEVNVYVKNVDVENKRIALSIKDTTPNPWFAKVEKYKEGDIIEGKIIKLTYFGAFMELEPGLDGLIPMGELTDHRVERADEAVHVGDVVEVKILKISMQRQRISLSIRRAKKNTEEAETVTEASEAPAQVETQSVSEPAEVEAAEN